MKRITIDLALTDDQIDALKPLYKQALKEYAHFCVIGEPFANPSRENKKLKFTVISEEEAYRLKDAMEGLKAGDTE